MLRAASAVLHAKVYLDDMYAKYLMPPIEYLKIFTCGISLELNFSGHQQSSAPWLWTLLVTSAAPQEPGPR